METQELKTCLYYPTNQNLDQLCKIIVKSEDPDPLIQKIIESRRLKSLYGQLSIRKRMLLSEIQDLYNHIQSLQKETISLHQHISMFEETVSYLFPHLPPTWQEKYSLEDENISDESSQEIEIKKSVKSATHHKKKKKKEKSIYRGLIHNNQNKKENFQRWTNYHKLDFDTLKSQKDLVKDLSYCESIKLMDHNIIRKRYDLSNQDQKKAFKREIAIYKYLHLCRFVPPLLYYNPVKGTIFIPYCGKIAKPKDKNRVILKALMSILSKEWGVTLNPTKNPNPNPTVDEQLNWCMIDHEQSHHYIFDFSHPNWKVEPTH